MKKILFLIILLQTSCNKQLTEEETQSSNCLQSFNEDKDGVYANWVNYGIDFNATIDKKRIKIYTPNKVYLDSVIYLDGAIGTSILIPKKELPTFFIVIDKNKCLVTPDTAYSIIHISYSDSLKMTYLNYGNSPMGVCGNN